MVPPAGTILNCYTWTYVYIVDWIYWLSIHQQKHTWTLYYILSRVERWLIVKRNALTQLHAKNFDMNRPGFTGGCWVRFMRLILTDLFVHSTSPLLQRVEYFRLAPAIDDYWTSPPIWVLPILRHQSCARNFYGEWLLPYKVHWWFQPRHCRSCRRHCQQKALCLLRLASRCSDRNILNSPVTMMNQPILLNRASIIESTAPVHPERSLFWQNATHANQQSAAHRRRWWMRHRQIPARLRRR